MRAALKTWLMLILAGALAACAQAGAPRLADTDYAAPGQDTQYTLSGGDKIHVIVFGEETLTGDYVLTSGGNLSFPLVGNLKASGLTVEQLQANLAQALSDGYVNKAQVSIQVVSFRPFYILGEVNRPGEYPVSTGLTLQQAVAAAGGYTYRANNRRAYLKRATETGEHLVDLKDNRTVVIRAGDTIRIVERHF